MDLVKYFRYSLKCTDELVTIHQELEFVKNYVEIQKIRYPESFYILYDVEDELLKEKIPPLILENFVENSIKYSLGNFITEILVIIKKREYFLQVSICDDGAGIDEEILKELEKEKPYVKDGETHVGIYNCVRRLRLFYGENVKFSITSKLGEGTQIWIEFPCTREEKEDEAIIG
jgi:two-component system sensor histidine kinase YesM